MRNGATFETQASMVFLAENTRLQEKYRFEKWLRLQRRVLAQIENEFEQEV